MPIKFVCNPGAIAGPTTAALPTAEGAVQVAMEELPFT